MAELSSAELDLPEIIGLATELNGASNPMTGEKLTNGLLGQTGIAFNIKYRLTKLFNKLNEEREVIEKLRIEMIKQFGSIKEGTEDQYEVLEKIKEGKKEVPNPNYELFAKEYKKLFEEKRKFEFGKVTVSDLEKLDTSESYPLVCKYVLIED